MTYQALYRKWRPMIFEDIVGQSHITKTLSNQILTNKIAHAYLFCGTRGTGKTTAAKVFSRAVNCLNNTSGSPCNECEICKGTIDGSIMDVIEIDAASNNGVDNIREIREEVAYVATYSKYRVYIIDEVHMLSTGAFNALLKTLEEPPEHVIFILATTEAHKVPQTILSRCQRFDFKRIKPSDIIVRMKEIATGDNLNITDEAYVLLARLADGSLRDGLTILERCISSYGNSLTVDDITNILGIATNEMVFKLTEYIINSDTVGILKSVDMLLSDGRDLHTFIDSVIKHMRDLMVCRVSDSPEELLDYSAEELVNIKAQSGRISFEKISNCITILTTAKTDAKWIKNPRVVYELALIKITKPELDDSTDALLDRIGNMEDQIKKGITVKAQRQEEAPIIEEKPKKEKKVSERLFVPIDRTTLTTSSPVVLAAKKWDKFVQNIGKKQPFLLAAVSNRSVTIDGEGLIMLFDKSETMTKQIAKTYIRTIEENFNSFCGGSFRIKEAFKEDVEDVIIDFWNLPDGDSKKKEKPKVDKDENDSPKEDLIHQTDKDPIDVLAEKFPEIVEFTDDSEFINYSTEDNKFSQTNMDGSDENDSEEFLETHEKEDEE